MEAVPGKTIHTLRTRHGLTQQALARRAGTTQTAVSRIERGLTSPTWETLRNLLLAMGYEADVAPRRLETRADALHMAALRRREPAERLKLAMSANLLAGRLREGAHE